MNTKYLFIQTMGCQMNVYDSRQIENGLAPLGYRPTGDVTQADLIIANTCSIRAKAEQKAFSFLGRLAPLKQNRPGLIVAIGGCVAQQEGRRVLSRMPHVDLVFGTHAIGRLPELVKRIDRERCRLVDVHQTDEMTAGEFISSPPVQSAVTAFVTVMRGCDNYCTYCVVPYVRGREASRHPDRILSEIRRLVDNGVREVTLLGQNVNSYGQKEGLVSFAGLLEEINKVPGLERIRFTTSHPKDLSPELMNAFARLDKLCHHIHLPVQSGSDRILKRMNRRYTAAHYRELIQQLRRIVPGVAISSDIIVGFPGETEQDFAATCELIREVDFDSLFAFIYSERPNAPAARFDGKVPEAVKKERLQAVLELQQVQTARKYAALVGSVQKVLVDGTGKKDPDTGLSSGAGDGAEGGGDNRWSGRTGGNIIVHFDQVESGSSGKQVLTGQILDIRIDKAMAHSLWGHPAVPEPAGARQKGSQTHAA